MHSRQGPRGSAAGAALLVATRFAGTDVIVPSLRWEASGKKTLESSKERRKKTGNLTPLQRAGARGLKGKMLEATANELLGDIYKASNDSRKEIGLQAEERHPLPSPTKLSRQPPSRNPQDDDGDGSDDADPSRASGASLLEEMAKAREIIEVGTTDKVVSDAKELIARGMLYLDTNKTLLSKDRVMLQKMLKHAGDHCALVYQRLLLDAD